MKQITASLFSVILIFLSATSNQATAAVYSARVSNSFDSCSMVNFGDESEVSLNIGFNSSIKLLGQGNLVSRALGLYDHLESGTDTTNVKSVTMNGEPSDSSMYILLTDYHYKSSASNKSWGNDADFSSHVVVRISNKTQQKRFGVLIGIANVGSTDVVFDNIGYVYINESSNGKCELYPSFGNIQPPSSPPPPPDNIDITVTAPDWNLGEIKPGQQSIPLSGSAEQLCLKYTGSSVAGKQFIINATNQNGVKNSLYRMSHLYNPSQEAPYILMLNNTMGGLTVLPNSYNSTITLNAGGSTCFIPTFITMAPENLEPGLYTDVLTFNIVTKA
ncbi:hypothetical protein [Erwinia sorbitola]|uniref:Fimbrial protein n=1 Tax=Erwinia sorbitola TaxID=2681984 RepID=A0A6I6F653_9GAMM|nr:hypothetical protein [Erwinia sorbitola]MTD29276.1 hypothetical protein [Erwinia sorbitola]QGU89360.1 hypothetical protein GN242_20045 [Erwinia sorbitola]